MTEEAAIWSRELVLVTGKGGVGKTTVAAALASAAHAAGKRVLLAEVVPDTSTDSQLLGLFGHGRTHGDEPTALKPRLDGLRIMPSLGHTLFLRDALKVRLVVDAAMRSAALNRFLSAAPAFPEIGVLYQLVSLLKSKRWDHIVLDLPATGHALGLVSLPRVVLRVLPAGLIGDAIKEGLAALTDPSRTGAVIVTLPEALPVTEAVELAGGLAKLEVPVRAMVLNRAPATVFVAEECAALEGHLLERVGGELLLGTREFRRRERAAAAQIEFRSTAPTGVRTLEIEDLEGATHQAAWAHAERAFGGQR